MNMWQILRSWRRHFETYVPLIRVEISKSAILHNYQVYKEKSDCEIAPVLKSNAYGHGLLEVARVMENTDAPFLVVDSMYEAIFLRRAHIKKPILIIGYVSQENILHSKLSRISFTVTSLEQLQQLALSARKSITIHVKIDTGMHRQGIVPSELEEVLRIVKNNPRLQLEGICSHLGSSDELGAVRTQEQFAVWNDVLARTETVFPQIRYKHISATSGANDESRAKGNMLRLGIGLYGIDPTEQLMSQLQQALTVYAPIVGIRTIKEGELVGYGNSFKAERAMTIAILPLGYFEGIDRRLSNVGTVILNGLECPIVGRICMNMILIDISHVPHAKMGDQVQVLGGPKALPCSIESAAQIAGMIPYELLVHIPQHLRRTLI